MMFNKQRRVGNVFLVLFLLLALGVSSWLVKKTQELSRRAAGDNAKVLLDPAPEVIGEVGDEKIIKIVADTSFNDKKVDFAEVNLCYGSEIEIVDLKNDVTVVDTEAFSSEFLKKSIYDSTDGSGKKCLVISVTNGDRPASETKSGVLVIASVKFKLVKNGETDIVVKPDGKNEVALYGQSQKIEIATMTGTKVKIGGTVGPDDAAISFEARAMSADKKNLTVSLIVDTKERKPDLVIATVCSNDVLEVSTEIGVTIPLSSPFTKIIKSEVEKSVVGPDVCWNIQVKQEKTSADILSGKQTVVEITYKVKKPGDYRIYLQKSPLLTAITGVPIMVGGEKKFKIDIGESGYGELTGTIVGDVTPTLPVIGGNILKFNVLIRGTRLSPEPEDYCSLKWNPVKVTVIDANGVEKTVDGTMTRTSEKVAVEPPATGFTPIWQIEANLGNFTSNENLLVLVKLPKHLQATFGQDKYIGRWVKKVGTIGGLTNDPATTPVFDFTGFRIQAGEVVAETGYEEGWLNVQDHSLIKLGIEKGWRGDEACPADANGDGIMNSWDDILFLGELAQKYGEKR